MPQTSGSAMTLVASSRPPSPTSTMQASAGTRAKARKAAAVVASKKLIVHVAGGVERFGEQGGKRLVVDQPPGEADALVEADEMRAGIDMDA